MSLSAWGYQSGHQDKVPTNPKLQTLGLNPFPVLEGWEQCVYDTAAQ